MRGWKNILATLLVIVCVLSQAYGDSIPRHHRRLAQLDAKSPTNPKSSSSPTTPTPIKTPLPVPAPAPVPTPLQSAALSLEAAASTPTLGIDAAVPLSKDSKSPLKPTPKSTPNKADKPNAKPSTPKVDDKSTSKPADNKPKVKDATITAETKAQKEAAVTEVVDKLNLDGTKADDAESLKKFATTEQAPEGGVRLVKDLLTGKLKPILPTADPAKASSDASSSTSPDAKQPASDEKLSAVVAASLAGKSDVAAPAVNTPASANSGETRTPNSPSSKTDQLTKKAPQPPRRHGHASSSTQFQNLLTRKGNPQNLRPTHISIGSSTGSEDVVRDSVVQPSWNVSDSTPPAIVEQSQVPASVDFTDFFLWRAVREGDHPKRVVTCQKPFVFLNNSEVLDVKITGWGPKHMTPVPISTPTKEDSTPPPPAKGKAKTKARKPNEILFSLQYECHKEGTSLVTVILRSFELTTGQRSSEPISFSFMKSCTKPSRSNANESNPAGNAALAGLSVGTFHNRSDVIVHGQALVPWTTLGTEGDEGSELYAYDVDIEGAKFWMRYEPPVANAKITVNKVVFLIDNPSVLLIEDSGDLTEQSTVLTSGRTYNLAITFTCKQEGVTNVAVAFNFPTIEAGKVSFAFRKICPGLVVGDGATMNGIDIFLAHKLNLTDVMANKIEPDVVNNGQVLSDWRPIQNLTLEGEKERNYLADEDTDFVSFFVRLHPRFHPVRYDPPVVESYSDSGDVILRPTLTGGIFESSQLLPTQPRFMVLAFNCIKSGDAVVTIKLSFRPTGALQFNLAKTCRLDTPAKEEAAAAVTEYSTGNELTPLLGINVGHYMDMATVARNGIPSPYYHLTENTADLMLINKTHQWVNFFLWKNSSYPGAKDIRFGRPEVISTADIARPVISGLGAEGGLVADNEYSTVSITFHCFTEGNTTITLIIPLVADEWLNIRNEPVKIPPIRSDPIKISFMKECPSVMEEPVIGMGGVGISGFSVGHSSNTSELVFNGFPQPKYFGQRMKPKPDWDDVIVSKEVDSSTFYVHFSSTGLKKALVAKEVMFQSPIVVSHSPTCRPVLAGAAANGGVLIRDGSALPLDLTYNCRYAGLAVVTLVIPIVPHGQISIDVPKYCLGDAPAHGVKMTGLHVGTTPTGSQVVKDGQTQTNYVAYATKKYLEHQVPPEEETTTFYIRKIGDSIRAIEPMIYAHKPIVNVRITHALRVNDTQIDDDVDGDEIEINEEVGMINITYSCVYAGTSDLTVSLNLIPKGQIQWTFEKQCPDIDFSPDELANLPFLLQGGITPGGSRSRTNKFGHGGPTWDADQVGDDYADYRRESGELDSLVDTSPPVPASGSIASKDTYANLDYNPHSSIDYTDSSRLNQLSGSGLSAFQIGTGTSGSELNDVFWRSLASTRYRLKSSKGKKLDLTQYAVIKPDEDESTFYFSSTSDGLQYGKPSLKLEPAGAGDFLQPVLSGAGSKGGVLSSNSRPVRLDIHYNCQQGGVFGVGVRVPIGDETANFRVIKICSNPELSEEFAWTAGRLMTLIGFITALIAIAIGAIKFRAIFQQKKAALYAPVGQSELEMGN